MNTLPNNPDRLAELRDIAADEVAAAAVTTDPESYTRPSDVAGVATDVLCTAYETARAIYYTCGGHWRAHRMECAMQSITAELETRNVRPVVDGRRVTAWQV